MYCNHDAKKDCRALLHTHTRTCICGALCGLRAAPESGYCLVWRTPSPMDVLERLTNIGGARPPPPPLLTFHSLWQNSLLHLWHKRIKKKLPVPLAPGSGGP